MSFFGHTVWGETGRGGEPLGMLAGAAVIFFAYIGFDSVSTHAEEAKQPHRDVPIGIIASLLICAVLYIAVAAVLTGMVRYDRINIDAPVSDAFRQVGLPWAKAGLPEGPTDTAKVPPSARSNVGPNRRRDSTARIQCPIRM